MALISLAVFVVVWHGLKSRSIPLKPRPSQAVSETSSGTSNLNLNY